MEHRVPTPPAPLIAAGVRAGATRGAAGQRSAPRRGRAGEAADDAEAPPGEEAAAARVRIHLPRGRRGRGGHRRERGARRRGDGSHGRARGRRTRRDGDAMTLVAGRRSSSARGRYTRARTRVCSVGNDEARRSRVAVGVVLDLRLSCRVD